MISTERLEILFLSKGQLDSIISNELKETELNVTNMKKWIKNLEIEELKYYSEDNINANEEVFMPVGIIIKKTRRRLIGDFQLNFKSNNKVEIGYEILEKYRRKGYGYEAISVIVEYLKSNFPEVYIYAKCFIDNKASQALLKKIGMIEQQRDCSLIYYKMK